MSLDHSRWIDAPVIASFDAQGNALPLYIRINGERYHVLNCKALGRKVSYFYFQAEVENYGRMTLLELGFWPEECVWRYSVE